MNICDVIVILNMYIVSLLCCKIVCDAESGVEDLYPEPEHFYVCKKLHSAPLMPSITHHINSSLVVVN